MSAFAEILTKDALVCLVMIDGTEIIGKVEDFSKEDGYVILVESAITITNPPNELKDKFEIGEPCYPEKIVMAVNNGGDFSDKIAVMIQNVSFVKTLKPSSETYNVYKQALYEKSNIGQA
jgi:hypothetical protein